MYKYQAIFSQETHAKEKIKGRCVFVISLSFHQADLPQIISQENTNDLDKFSAVIRRLNVAFEEIDIILSDKLNKHNSSIYFPNDDPNEKSLALGDAWLGSAYFSKVKDSLTKKYLIKRWDELISENNFDDAKLIIEDLYKNNMEFCAIVDSVRAEFLTFICRKRKKTFENKYTPIDYSNFNMDKAYENCLKYILEESAVTLVFRLSGYANLFHIGKVNDAVNWIAKNTINLGYKHSDIIKSINDNPLKVFTVSKFTSCQSSVNTTSDKIKSKEKTRHPFENIFKRKTFNTSTHDTVPLNLRRRFSVN